MLDFLADLWNPDEAVFMGRLALAALLGGLIGFERERSSQAAGLRTHMIVTLGAALMTIISIKIGDAYGGDRARIAAQIVTGIGFLGAGAIMRYGTSIRGLTTAACLWTSAGIGLAVGSGYYAGAAIATALTLFATLVLGRFEKRFFVEKVVKRITIVADDGPNLTNSVAAILKRFDIQAREFGLERDLRNRKQKLEVSTVLPETCDLDAVSREIAAVAHVDKIDID